ncbi:DUF2306 domain-containing protein [Abyssibacter sp.]|uniref:DUF2306 domain-containing protein n=1 Tax=Abyssibacter sp. TaxID=2320200 RepID=UPI00351854D3
MPSSNVAAHPANVTAPLHLAPSRNTGAALLYRAGQAWLAVAIAGQLLMAGYVAWFYGGAALQGQPERWNKTLQQGYVPGEPMLNAVLASHLFLVMVIVIGGALQLLPSLRRSYAGLHRWIGRGYLATASVLSLSGLYLIWVGGGTPGDVPQKLGTSFNGLLILVFATMAWRAARRRQTAFHRRWALRLFIAVSGVWFFRLALTLWLAIHQAPVGFDPETFTGPTLSILTFAQFLVPLAVLELYFRAQASPASRLWQPTSVVLVAATLLTAAGITTASMMLWLPRF